MNLIGFSKTFSICVYFLINHGKEVAIQLTKYLDHDCASGETTTYWGRWPCKRFMMNIAFDVGIRSANCPSYAARSVVS